MDAEADEAIRAAVSDEQVERYRTDGVVCLRGVIDEHWLERLRIGVERNLAAPSPRGRIWDRDEAGRVTFYDSQVWRAIDEYRDFVFGSPMAPIAGRLMEATRVNFFFDAIFCRAPGSQFRTPFHQDEPYWSVEGFDCASSWMPLVPVERRSALESVPGSHRWNRRYRQTNFGALTGDERDQVAFDDGAEPFPDVDHHPERFGLVAWDMAPGDVAVFNARIIHGGSGRLAPDRRLEVFNTQWLGDDVRVRFRPTGMDPDHTAVMSAVGLRDGDRVDDADGATLYPRLWSAQTDVEDSVVTA